MADPFSIVAGVVGTAAATIQLTEALFRVVNDIKSGSEAIKWIVDDVRAYHTVVSSFALLLRDESVYAAVAADASMTDLILNLKRPLDSSRAILGKLLGKIERVSVAESQSKGLRNLVSSLGWSLRTKGEVREMQKDLEHAKSTLNSALSVITAYAMMRSWTMGSSLGAYESNWLSGSGASVSLSRASRLSPIALEPGTQIESLGPTGHQKPVPRRPRRLLGVEAQTQSNVVSLVHETQQVFTSGDHSLRRPLARAYRDLAASRPQLRSMVYQYAKSRGGSAATSSSDQEDSSVPEETPQAYDGVQDSEYATEVFFDCVSRFSTDDTVSSLDRLGANFSGSPEYFMESRPTFYPEQYAIGQINRGDIFISAIRYSRGDYLTLKYFVMYAETLRCWRRVIVSASFDETKPPSALGASEPDDHEQQPKTIPTNVQEWFKMIISSFELLDSVTTISVNFRTDDTCDKASPEITAFEDDTERMMSNEDDILQDIEDFGCPKFCEAHVGIKAPINSRDYLAWVESRPCVKRVAPFASSGTLAENKFQTFFKEIRLMKSFRDYSGVAQFIGIVLDDQKRHLKAYLREYVPISNMARLFGHANHRSDTIPWSIREGWARQIIHIVAQVHGRGQIVGNLGLNNFAMRLDGTVVLSKFRPSEAGMMNRLGRIPPEMRDRFQSSSEKDSFMNFRTDIFQLGHVLWLIAEHRCHAWGYFCIRSACTNFPRFSCPADHANPIDLPHCSAGIPAYFDGIVSKCRSLDARHRPTAWRLAAEIDSEAAETSAEQPSDIAKLVERYPDLDTHFSIHCQECGALLPDEHYHCRLCKHLSFDFCSSCVRLGVHCGVPGHQFVKRRRKNGIIVDDSKS